MTKLPSRRLLLSAAFASTLVVTGCDVSTSSDKTPTSAIAYNGVCSVVDAATQSQCLLIPGTPTTIPGLPPVYIPGTYPRFNPAASDVPLNTDFPFAGSTDGTAYLNATGTVQDAINRLDGWSTDAYFDVAFSASIDPATVNDGSNPLTAAYQNVFLLPLETVANGDPLNPADINATSPFSPANVTATKYTASVVSLDGGTNNVLRIKPTSPLFAKKKFLVVVTNGIKDAAATPITKSAPYDLIGSTGPLVDPKLVPVRDAIQAWEKLAIGFLQYRNGQLNFAYPALGLPTDSATLEQSLALTYTFTTTDPVTPLVGMGSPRAALFSPIAATAGASTAISLLTWADANGVIPSPKPRTVVFPTPSGSNSFDLGTLSGGALASSVATLYTGAITLPYYQTAPTSPAAADVTFLGKFWTGDNNLAAAPPPTSTGLGLPVPADTDATYNVTYRFPFAKQTGSVTVPLQVTLPNPAMTPAGFPANCGTVYGTSGYPVVIYVHGITSDRSSVLALAHSLAGKACIATVAIDLPMHGLAPSNPLWHYLNVNHANGSTVASDLAAIAPTIYERHFDVAQTALGLPAAMNFGATSDGSGAWFINLANLLNTRDNVREAVVDLLNLNASLGSIMADGTSKFDVTKVAVVGISLGGMIATDFVTVNQEVLANEAALNLATSGAFPVRLNPVNSLVASVTGGQLTRILENSASFGPKVLSGVAAAGAAPGTSNYEAFMYTAQSTVDSGDPLNFAAALANLPTGFKVPVLVQEIVGGANLGDGVYPSDRVVPNNVNTPVTQIYNPGTGPVSYTTDTAPLAGTDPLLAQLGISASATLPGALDLSFATGKGAGVAKLQFGYHSSLLTTSAGGPPSAGNTLATGELETEAVSFTVNPASTYVGTAGSNAASAFMTALTRP